MPYIHLSSIYFHLANRVTFKLYNHSTMLKIAQAVRHQVHVTEGDSGAGVVSICGGGIAAGLGSCATKNSDVWRVSVNERRLSAWRRCVCEGGSDVCRGLYV